MDPEAIPTALVATPPAPDLGLLPTSGFRGLPSSESELPTGRFAGFPRVGDRIENCTLVAELGRGASGLVFLAVQESLANRPIVLKVTTDASRGEHLNLARLQHTYVMPLYWASALPYEGLHVLAMPYLARTTLSRLLFRLTGTVAADRTGRHVAETLDADQAVGGVTIAVHEHPLEVLKGSTWTEFVVRVGHLLADTLAFVHRRDLVHLDLKPGNVLVTPDGQPVLLDLDIASRPVARGTATLPWLGGTFEFMSPEQREAIEALKENRPIPAALDGHSDQYSLGLLLYCALLAVGIPDDPPDVARLRKENPDVSPGLAAILARCLNPDQADRYPDCHALAEDLRRHEQHLPLRGVGNRPGERWRKWRTRRPLGLPLVVVVAVFCAAMVAAGFHLYRTDEDRRRQAEAALLEGQDWQRKGHHEAAVQRFLAGKEFAEGTRGGGELVARLNARLALAVRMQKAGELADAVHLMRFYALQEHTPRRLQWVMEGAARRLWADRTLLLDDAIGALEPAAERGIRDQLQELVLLWTASHVRIAPPEHAGAARAEARAVVADAEALFGRTTAIDLAWNRLGDPPRAPTPPKSGWEFCALGRDALAGGDFAAANRAFDAALDRDPLGFVPNFHLGVGALRNAECERAVRAFSYCAGRDPKPECFLLRGQAYAALGEPDAALRDYTRAVEGNPEFAAAYAARGRLLAGLARTKEAEQDEARARQLGE